MPLFNARLSVEQLADLTMLSSAQAITKTALLKQWIRRAKAHLGKAGRPKTEASQEKKKESSKERNTYTLTLTPQELQPEQDRKELQKQLYQQLAAQVHAYYCEVMDKDPQFYRLTEVREKKLVTRLKELRDMAAKGNPQLNGHGRMDAVLALAKAVIDNVAADDFLMGREEGHPKRFNDLIANCFRSYEQMEKRLQ